MTERITSELISRRRTFSLLGVTAAIGFAAPAMALMASDAAAQTNGMERRGERREGRHERRDTRREGRDDRRDARRGGDKETTGTGTTSTEAATGTK
jgi:hypothetical protein